MDADIPNALLDDVEGPAMPEGFMRAFNSLKLSAIPMSTLPILILMKTESEAEVLKSVIQDISNRYGLRVSVCTFTSAYDALFYMEQPCTRDTTVYTFDTLDRVHTETSISQRAEIALVNASKAKAIIMDNQFAADPDMHRAMNAGGLLELMVVLLSSEETLALQMAAAPTKLYGNLPPRELTIFRFGFEEEPQQLLAPAVQTILGAFMNELVNWIRRHAPQRPAS